MLADLVRSDSEDHSGLQSYLRNMMGVMAFDTARCGRIISQAELAEYTRMLATAVSEAMCYFIGHGEVQPTAPHTETCYPSVIAAHITHMLRDTIEDVEAGYFNIPGEYLQSQAISANDVESPAYHEWVTQRIQLARAHFKAGRACIARVQKPPPAPGGLCLHRPLRIRFTPDRARSWPLAPRLPGAKRAAGRPLDGLVDPGVVPRLPLVKS